MLIARQKLNENIAEYILYMFQIEDLIRAYHFNLDQLIEQFVKPQLPDNSFLEQYKEWYRGLIGQMKAQKIEQNGHLNDLKEILIELSYLHNTLLTISNDPKYKTLFETAQPYINEFREKSNLKDKNDLEAAFHAMYMKLLLRLQHKDISAETEEAFDSMRILLAYLARAYKQMKTGDLSIFSNN